MTPSRASRGRPTLLVFTLGAAGESRRRKLLPAALGDVEEELHRAGRDFGERLERAIEAARAPPPPA